MIKRVKILLVVTIFFCAAGLFLSPAFPMQAQEVKSPVGMVWKNQVKGRSYSPFVVKNSRIYIGTEEGVLNALGRNDGEQKWS